MKYFFYLLVCGFSAGGCGIALAYGGILGWQKIAPNFGFDKDSFSISRSITNMVEEARASTLLSGLTHTVRFSAHDEEDKSSKILMPVFSGSLNGSITADSYVLKNLNTGTILTEYGADTVLPIASITKLVTAVIARRKIEPHKHIVISDEIISVYGNTAGFKEGETFRADDLLYPLLMVSSNDAAEAFAADYGRKEFIKAMNDFTQEIGAYRTYFADPSGLSSHNVSSANDFLVIIDWIRKNDPEIIEITAMKSKTVRVHTWVNPTHFLSWSYYLGGKNGYTPEAGRTAVSLFEIGQNKDLYAVVVLGSKTRDEDVAKILGRIE